MRSPLPATGSTDAMCRIARRRALALERAEVIRNFWQQLDLRQKSCRSVSRSFRELFGDGESQPQSRPQAFSHPHSGRVTPSQMWRKAATGRRGSPPLPRTVNLTSRPAAFPLRMRPSRSPVQPSAPTHICCLPARIRRRERDLFGQLVTVRQTIRTSNAYRFIDPLDCEPGRKGYESENPTRPQNQDLNSKRARPHGAQNSFPWQRQCHQRGR